MPLIKIIVFGWINKNLNVHEDFIGLHQVDNTSASTVNKSVLLAMNLDIHSMRGQCYDGASTMFGTRTGVAEQIQQEEPKVIFTYCYGHALNFCHRRQNKGLQGSKNALDITLEISKLVKKSPKRDAMFLKLKDELQPEAPGIRVLCPHHWTVRADSLKSVLDNHVVLQELWEEAHEVVSESEMRGRIGGVAVQMMIGVYLRQTVLRHLDNLSRVLQKKNLSAAEGQH